MAEFAPHLVAGGAMMLSIILMLLVDELGTIEASFVSVSLMLGVIIGPIPLVVSCSTPIPAAVLWGSAAITALVVGTVATSVWRLKQ